MNRIINLNIPHIGEQIFENFEDEELIRLLSVSETWRVLASNVLLQRWRGNFADACCDASPELLKFLLANLKTEEILNLNEHGYTPFQIACASGNEEIVKIILDHPDIKSMDLNAVDENGCTAFQLACELENNEVVQLLLDHTKSKNIDFNAVDKKGRTAFLWACELRKTKVVQLLLDHPNSKNIDFNAVGPDGRTAFQSACRRGSNEVVQLLLESNASIDFTIPKNAFLCREVKDLMKKFGKL